MESFATHSQNFDVYRSLDYVFVMYKVLCDNRIYRKHLDQLGFRVHFNITSNDKVIEPWTDEDLNEPHNNEPLITSSVSQQVLKVSVFGVFLVRIFPHLDRISPYSVPMRKNTDQKNSDKKNTDSFHAVQLILNFQYYTITNSNSFLNSKKASYYANLIRAKIQSFNPFAANIPTLYPLKTPENQSFSSVFGKYKKGTSTANELTSKATLTEFPHTITPWTQNVD